MSARIAAYNADNYTSQADALANGAFYPQNSDWTYDDYSGLQDLLEICDAINICHNGQHDRSKAQFVLVIKDGEEWLPLERWNRIREEVYGKSHYSLDYIAKNNPTKIGEVDGITYYENPEHGDEGPLLLVYGSLVGTSHFWELPAEGEY